MGRMLKHGSFYVVMVGRHYLRYTIGSVDAYERSNTTQHVNAAYQFPTLEAAEEQARRAVGREALRYQPKPVHIQRVTVEEVAL